MKATVLRLFVAAASLTMHFSVQAEDIDLFVSPSTGSTVKPNVLIIMDNTANWGSGNNSPQPFTNEKAALVSVLGNLPVDSFRVGLMMFSEPGNPNDTVDGAYVRAALRLMNSTNQAAYVNLVESLDSNNDKGNNPVYGLAMAEAYRYFDGGTAYGGARKVKRDYAGNSIAVNGGGSQDDPYASSNAVYALAGNALADSSSTRYVSPIEDGCQRNFIIFISNGSVSNNDSDGESDQPRSMLIQAYQDEGGYDNPTAIAKSARIAISPTGETTSTANEWSKFLKSTFPGAVTTYTVDVNPAAGGQGPAHSALLKSMASVSAGKYFAVTSDSSAIAAALNSILSEIQSVNSAFASVSLPVSVNAQGTYLNQVFIGMFRPDANAGPLWAGNLKQYRLGYSGGELKLVGADGRAAINTSTNFITECARSYWTPATADNYWAFNPKGDCLEVANSDVSDSPDGAVVEKGGQGYGLRISAPAARSVLTCSPVFSDCDSSADQLTSLNTGNAAITDGLLGASSSAEREDLINWARGQDVPTFVFADGVTRVVGDENNNGNTSETRPSVHGDVVHSRPVAVNYGSAGSPNVVVFYGGNDGLLHAINGNRTAAYDTSSVYAAGEELWSFMPPEFYSRIKRLRANSPAVRYLGGPTSNPPKDYGVDGAVTAYMGKTSASSSDKTFIYFGMRRGGRALYAFDVTDPTDPELKWKIGCPNLANDTGCTPDFVDIGQTWSSATELKADAYRDVSADPDVPGFAKPMLIFGGGYDACEDTDNGTVNHSCTSSSKGRNIYIVDADTGAHLKTFSTDRPVVADVTVVPDSSGLAQYAYAADTGGNIYRITIGSAARADWSIDKIASLGCSTMSSCNANRKFMFAPEVVLRDGVYYLQIGSGDREKPLAGYTAAASVSNYVFNIADKPGDSAWLAQGQCDSDGTACLSSLLPITTSTPTEASLASYPRGWYLALADNEQVVTSAVTLFGYSIFNTHTPTPPSGSSCTSLGPNKSYRISYRDASGENGDRYEVLLGGGLSPSPVSGIVQLDPVDGSDEIPFVCTLDCEEAEPTYTSQTQPKRRVYWNVEK